MPSDPKTAKKPYSSPSLVKLDANAVKAKLAKENPKDPIVLEMLSLIDGQPKKKKRSRIRSPEKDLPKSDRPGLPDES